MVAWDAPKNPANVSRVYEAWGWTDVSKSYPYVVVFSERPARIRVGADVPDEGIFAGYFLKIMTYEAFDKRRAAPLLIGRIQALDRPGRREGASCGIHPVWYWTAGGALVFLLVAGAWNRRPRARSTVESGPATDSDISVEDWLSRPSGGTPQGTAPASPDSETG